MDYLIACACGHSLEKHESGDGCERCACPRNRAAALDALIEAVRDDATRARRDDGAGRAHVT
jgi:hypothetical protein